jgi:hypothetical protein
MIAVGVVHPHSGKTTGQLRTIRVYPSERGLVFVILHLVFGLEDLLAHSIFPGVTILTCHNGL